jgi:condensin complex subunit 3
METVAANGNGEDEEAAEGISSRFVEHLMRHLFKGVRVKEKQVRIRSCQLLALSTNSLGAMEYVLDPPDITGRILSGLGQA